MGFRDWAHAVNIMKHYNDKTGLDDELDLTAFKCILAPICGVTAGVQRIVDLRESARDDSQIPTALSTVRVSEAEKFMRYSSAAYGAAIMEVFGLIPRPGLWQSTRMLFSGVKRIVTGLVTGDDPNEGILEKKTICLHCDIPCEDLITMSTESLDWDGNPDCVRHLVAVDRASKAVVLALRG